MVTACTACSNKNKHYISPRQCFCEFRIILAINSCISLIQCQLIRLPNGEAVRCLWRKRELYLCVACVTLWHAPPPPSPSTHARALRSWQVLAVVSFFGVYVTSFRRSAAAEVSVAAVLLIKLSSYTLNSSVICGSLNDAIYCKMAGLMTISDLEMAWNPAIVP